MRSRFWELRSWTNSCGLEKLLERRRGGEGQLQPWAWEPWERMSMFVCVSCLLRGFWVQRCTRRSECKAPTTGWRHQGRPQAGIGGLASGEASAIGTSAWAEKLLACKAAQNKAHLPGTLTDAA